MRLHHKHLAAYTEQHIYTKSKVLNRTDASTIVTLDSVTKNENAIVIRNRTLVLNTSPINTMRDHPHDLNL